MDKPSFNGAVGREEMAAKFREYLTGFNNQVEAAEAMSISQSMVSQLKFGDRPFPAHVAERLGYRREVCYVPKRGAK